MKNSPLQLEKHFFSKISLDALQESPTHKDYSSSCEIDVAKDSQDSRRFQVGLKFLMASKPDSKCSYSAEIHAVGLFRVDESWPEDKVQILVDVNGPSVLYGAIRELLINLTSRGPWPAVALDAVSFAPIKKQSKEKNQEDTPAV